MVRTLTNAFAAGRIAHAFMLTGVRGVGKTTTARLLARALNYEREGVDHPSVDLAIEGRHCQAIIEGRHIDVLELDAASRTKVDEMRELLDGVRYAPVEARYKVYIIDEVHMLSTAAFNALLKTLEEPPPHAKFIFATTEIRKVPVTILSRCQRFDLRRVEPEVIVQNLEKIGEAEGARGRQRGTSAHSAGCGRLGARRPVDARPGDRPGRAGPDGHRRDHPRHAGPGRPGPDHRPARTGDEGRDGPGAGNLPHPVRLRRRSGAGGGRPARARPRGVPWPRRWVPPPWPCPRNRPRG